MVIGVIIAGLITFFIIFICTEDAGSALKYSILVAIGIALLCTKFGFALIILLILIILGMIF